MEKSTLHDTDVSEFPLAELLGAEISGPEIKPGSSVRAGTGTMLKLRTTKGIVNFVDHATDVRKGQMEEQAAEIDACVASRGREPLRIGREGMMGSGFTRDYLTARRRGRSSS